MDPRDFYLDPEKVAKGVKLPLFGPNNQITEHWLRVRSIHSEEVQAKLTEEYRTAYESGEFDPDKPVNLKDVTKRIRHLLISEWSFDTPCTPEAVKELLDNNHFIADRVLQKAEGYHLFFPDTATSSSSGPDTSSSSRRKKAETPSASS